MSLLSKKNLFASLDKPESDSIHPNAGTSGKRRKKSQQQQRQKRQFQIADQPLKIDLPVLGKNDGGSADTFLSSLSSSASSDLFLNPSSSSNSLFSPAPTTSRKSKLVEEALVASKLSTLTPDGPIEPSPRLGKRKLKAAKKYAKSLTKGSKWFNIAKVEITKEKKNDLEALKLRSAMDGIYHYKRNHMTHTPKYFHVGTVVETSADFYSSRLTKKQRKKTLAEEFAADYGI